MSEPIFERLTRFTPDAGKLERDALLYAAGRDSARPNRPWIILAAALAVAQPLSLLVLWPHPLPSVHQPVQVVYLSAPSAAVAFGMGEDSDCPGLWSVRHSFADLEREERSVPADAVTFVESGPPLRAFGPPPPSILN